MNKRIFLMMLVILPAVKLKADNYAPVVRIENPKTGSNFKINEEITFKGKATDLEDGELSGKSLVWTSDMDGLIGQGNSLDTILSEGSHIVILTATDLEGSSARDSVFIIVGTPKITEPVDEIKIKEPEPEKPKPEKPKIQEAKVEKKALPCLEFVFVPPFGSFEDLKGRLLNGDPNQFAVAVYTMIEGLWFTKPSLEKPVTKINKDGIWICDITTAENDELAIKIVAYLIPIDYKPPLASGEFWILKEIEEKCLTKIEVTRKITSSKELPEKKAEIEEKINLKDTQKTQKPESKESDVAKESIDAPEKKLAELKAQESKILDALKKITEDLARDRQRLHELWAEKENMERYFPLAVGNNWKYKRTVFPEKTSLHRFEYEVIEDLDMTGDEGHKILQIGIEPFITTRDEIYEIISVEDKNFNIKGYSINEKGENEEAQGFEPYELMELERLIWRMNEWSDKTFVVFEIKEGNHLGNKVHCSELIGSLKPESAFLINVDPNSKPERYHKKVKTEYGEIIKVLAGTFNKTLKNTFEFIGGTAIEEVKIIRFFAKDVGLVKEVQYDSKGEITYTLELIEYKVK